MLKSYLQFLIKKILLLQKYKTKTQFKCIKDSTSGIIFLNKNNFQVTLKKK